MLTALLLSVALTTATSFHNVVSLRQNGVRDAPLPVVVLDRRESGRSRFSSPALPSVEFVNAGCTYLRVDRGVGVRLIKWETIIDKPNAAFGKVRERLFSDIKMAIEAVVWPSGAATFTIYAQSGKKRGEGNGVKPIKDAFVALLESRGWIPEREYPKVDATLRPPGPFDAFWTTPSILPFVAEWETGNVSSSHRAVNKILMGMQDQRITGGVLVLPTRKMAKYLTDRVGNFEEIEPYFRFWKKSATVGYLAIIAVEHDRESDEVPRIGKGTDGRALL